MINFIEVTLLEDNIPLLLPISAIKAVYPEESGAFILTDDNDKENEYGISVKESYNVVRAMLLPFGGNK